MSTPAIETADPSAAPITVLIAALGGEGGAVLADWLRDAASSAGLPVQGTSIPGVAQRTGATTYYLEIFPVPLAQLAGRLPLLALTPTPGNVDLMVASELVEAGRALQNGWVSERTTLIASSHRVFATSEKMVPGDGRFDAQRIIDAAPQLAGHAVLFDMAAAAQAAGTVISAVMFGAMAGSGRLGLSRAACEDAIKASGRGVQASLRGFDAGFVATATAATATATATAAATATATATANANANATATATATATVATRTTAAAAAAERDAAEPVGMHSRSDAGTSPHAGPDRHASAKTAVAPMLRDFAAPAHAFIVESLRRLTDYQDAAYAGLYLERLRPIARLDTPDGRLTAETARYLALWMCFEDLIRVADLKTRASRMQRVRAEVGAAPDEPLHIIEFLKPGLDEICGMLTPGLGRRLHAWALRRGLEHKLSPGLHLKTSSVFGFLLLRATASLRFWRRHSARYAEEQQLIERWLAAVLLAAGRSPELACEIALTARLIKGYGDTNMRGKASFKRILDHLVEGPAVSGDQARAQAIGQAREAALADAQGRGLDQVLGRHGIAPQPLRAVPIRFMKDAAGTRKQPRG